MADAAGSYVARVENVLDLKPRNPIRNARWFCFDERPPNWIDETRQPIPPELGEPQCYDCEHGRNDTADLFVFVDAHRRGREVKITDQRTAADFARCMRDLVDTHYASATPIRVALDILSTHTTGALYELSPHQRNAERARIKWTFATERVRDKLARIYPTIANES